jgi:hypothetical protein
MILIGGELLLGGVAAAFAFWRSTPQTAEEFLASGQA